MSATPYPTQPTGVPQQSQIIVQQPGKEYHSFVVRKAVSTGGTQLVLGVLAIIFQICATAIDSELGDAAGGIWAGFFVSNSQIIRITSDQPVLPTEIWWHRDLRLPQFCFCFCSVTLLLGVSCSHCPVSLPRYPTHLTTFCTSRNILDLEDTGYCM